MLTYEFSTTIQENGTIVMPTQYKKKLPKGERVHVIVVIQREHNPPAATAAEQRDYPSEAAFELADFPSLEEIVQRIQNTPPNLNNLTGSNDLLVERLLHPITEPDPAFDLAAWTKEWERVEAEMKAASLAHEAAEVQEWLQ